MIFCSFRLWILQGISNFVLILGWRDYWILQPGAKLKHDRGLFYGRRKGAKAKYIYKTFKIAKTDRAIDSHSNNIWICKSHGTFCNKTTTNAIERRTGYYVSLDEETLFRTCYMIWRRKNTKDNDVSKNVIK